MKEPLNESRDAIGRSECLVMKFGGTSLEDAAAIRRAGQLIKRRLRHRPVVVVSALAKVTDQLLKAGKTASEGHAGSAAEIVGQLRQRHHTVARESVEKQQYECLCAELEREFEVLDRLLGEIDAAREFSLQVQDRFLGVGEYLSSKLVHAALLRVGLDVAWVDAKECIVTDAAHTQAKPLVEETNERLRAILSPLLHSGQVPVLGGFIGATREGAPTTLGRGGSDLTATIIGAGLHANRIEMWTNVDGVMTTDPNLYPNARRVTTLSFNEAAELAYFGAKVLHPAMLVPAMKCNIPVWVLNSRNPESGGTEIAAHTSEGGRVKAITAKCGISVVDVELYPWFAADLLRNVFEVFERHHQSLELLSAARGTWSLVVSSTTATALPAIAEELKGLASVRWENQKALVSLVGEKIRRRPDITSQVLHAISDIDLRMICQGASERTISFLVDEPRVEETVRRLHELLFSVPSRLTEEPAQTVYQPGSAC